MLLLSFTLCRIQRQVYEQHGNMFITRRVYVRGATARVSVSAVDYVFSLFVFLYVTRGSALTVDDLFLFNSWGQVTCIFLGKLGHHWFRSWSVACSAPDHYQNQCWIIVNRIPRNNFYWNFRQNTCSAPIQHNPMQWLQSNVWTNADVLSIESLGTNFSEILIKTRKKMQLKYVICQMSAILSCPTLTTGQPPHQLRCWWTSSPVPMQHWHFGSRPRLLHSPSLITVGQSVQNEIQDMAFNQIGWCHGLCDWLIYI